MQQPRNLPRAVVEVLPHVQCERDGHADLVKPRDLVLQRTDVSNCGDALEFLGQWTRPGFFDARFVHPTAEETAHDSFRAP